MNYRKVLLLVLIGGALLWNSWVLGGLNHGLAGYFGMSISALEANGQSFVGLFLRSPQRSRLLLLIGIILASIGLLTIFDAAHPLDCNAYQNFTCATLQATGQVSHTDMLHESESRLTAYATIFLGLVLALWTIICRFPRREILLAIALAVGIIAALAIQDTSTSILANAIAERLWNVFVTIDIVYVGWKLLPAPAKSH